MIHMRREYVIVSFGSKCVVWMQMFREYVSMSAGAMQSGGACIFSLPACFAPGHENKSRDRKRRLGDNAKIKNKIHLSKKFECSF